MGCKECRLIRESKGPVYSSRQITTVGLRSEQPSTDRLNISIDEQLRRVHPRQKHLIADIDDYPDVPNLDNLPVELLYYLFDRLDASTIVTSLYNVCQRLNTVVKTYNHYHLNFKSISIPTYRQMCSIIRPEQVVALTLCDGNENVGLVKSFLRKFQLDSFERLRTLNLINITDNQQMIQLCLGISDQIEKLSIENHRGRYNGTVIDILLNVFGKPNLRNLVLDLSIAHPWSFPSIWSMECSLRQIRFLGLCSLTLLRNILIASPNLEIFETEDIDFTDEWRNDWSDEDSNDEDHEQVHPRLIQDILCADRLKSLSLLSCHNEMEILEWFIPQFSQLIHFKYINNDPYHLNSSIEADRNIFDGQRWAKILQHCEKFEFILVYYLHWSSIWNSHQALSTFQNEFWQKKNWLTGLEENETLAVIFSIPYAYHSHYYGGSNFVSMPNNPLMLSKAMDNVTKLRIDMVALKKFSKTITKPIRFPHISQVVLDNHWDDLETLDALRNLVKLSNVVKMIRLEPVPTFLFQGLLSELSHLQSLTLTTILIDDLNPVHFRYFQSLSSLNIIQLDDNDRHHLNVESLCSMFPQIEHLDMPVNQLDSCQYVVDHLKTTLISVVFRFSPDDDDGDDDQDGEFHQKLVQWARHVRRYHKYHVHDSDIFLWLSSA